MAAAYRRFPLTIWSINPPKIVKRFTRERISGRPGVPLPFASKISWHPNSEEILGLLIDGYSFRFSILDDRLEEHPPDPAKMPADIHCSPDGMIYAVRGTGGTIKLYDYHSATLIYQLTSRGDSVSSFCFSQDGRRFFQLRGNHCTVWEPNSLIRLSAVDDHAVNSQSSPEESIEPSNVASEALTDDKPPIMVASLSAKSSLICLGDEDGLIELLDHETMQKLEVGRTATELSIEHVAWGINCDRFCYSEVSGGSLLSRSRAPREDGSTAGSNVLSPNWNEMGFFKYFFHPTVDRYWSYLTHERNVGHLHRQISWQRASRV